MKTNFRSGVALFLLVLLSLGSCKKDKDDVPQNQDLAASVSGRYDMSYLKVETDNGDASDDFATNLPANTTDGEISGVVNVVKETENTAKVTMILMQDGQRIGEETAFGDAVDLKEENAGVAMYIGTDKIGTISGDNLNISITDGQGELIVRAKK